MKRFLFALAALALSFLPARAQLALLGAGGPPSSGPSSSSYVANAFHMPPGYGLFTPQLLASGTCHGIVSYWRRSNWVLPASNTTVVNTDTAAEREGNYQSTGSGEGVPDFWEGNDTPGTGVNTFRFQYQTGANATEGGFTGPYKPQTAWNSGLWHHFLYSVNVCGSGTIGSVGYIDNTQMLAYGPNNYAGTLSYNAGLAASIQASSTNITAGYQFNIPEVNTGISGDMADFELWTNTDIVTRCTGARAPVATCGQSYAAAGGYCTMNGGASCVIAPLDLANFVGTGTPGFGSAAVPVNPAAAIAAYGTPSVLLQGPVLGGSNPFISTTTGLPNNQGNAVSGGGSPLQFAGLSGGQYGSGTAGAITSATANAGVCAVTYTGGLAYLPVGAPILVTGNSTPAYNGTWLIASFANGTTRTVTYNCPATVAGGSSGTLVNFVSGYSGVVTSASWSGGVATIAYTGGDQKLSVGTYVDIENVTPSGYNGIYQVASNPSAGTITYDLSSYPGTFTGYGEVTKQPFWDVTNGPSGASSSVPGLKWICVSSGGASGATYNYAIPPYGGSAITAASWTAQPTWAAGGSTAVTLASAPGASLQVGEWINLTGFGTTGASLNGWFYIHSVSGSTVTIAGPSTSPGAIAYASAAVAAKTTYSFNVATCDGATPDAITQNAIQPGDLLVAFGVLDSNSAVSGATSGCTENGPNSGQFSTAGQTHWPSATTGAYNGASGYPEITCAAAWVANGTEQPPFMFTTGWTGMSVKGAQTILLDYGQSQIDASATGGGFNTPLWTSTPSAPQITAPSTNQDLVVALFGMWGGNYSQYGPFTCPGALYGTAGRGTTPMARRWDAGQPELLICEGLLPAGQASNSLITATSSTGPNSSSNLSIAIKHD